MRGVRKSVIVAETVTADAAGRPCEPIVRVAAMAVLANPFAGRVVDDLSELFDLSREIGAALFPEAVARLGRAPISYGKGALVGVAGEVEHGAATIHPRLGAPMRAALGGGAALIPSNCRIGAAGAALDLPLGHKDEAWSFDHFDTMTVMVSDAPRPDEILLVMGVADGGRANPRCGDGPIRD
ncbi:MAG: amino acid synthesis family protein [Paracoccaceae bacterium]